MPRDDVRRILAVEDEHVLDNHPKVLVVSVHNDASSHSMMNERVDVECCTPRTGLACC